MQDSRITIAGGSANAAAQFRPSAPGTTTLAIDPPSGFNTPAQFATLTATVMMPGIAVADDVAVGQNLQTEATVSLGEPAPAGGLDVKISSEIQAACCFPQAPPKWDTARSRFECQPVRSRHRTSCKESVTAER